MIESKLKEAVCAILKNEFNAEVTTDTITINLTKKEHEGDYTVVVFPLTRYSRLTPEKTGEFLGEKLQQHTSFIGKYNVIKGFLNLSLSNEFWLNRLQQILADSHYGKQDPKKEKVVLEYCGPNTNKPLHIGHVRNMLLGFSMSEILKENGYNVTKVNIYNDRGIAICKSMVAYIRYANGATPESTDIKGDHFVGDWYVKFNEAVKEEVKSLVNPPAEKEEAEKLTPIFKEAQQMLLKWEAGDPETIALWKKMNGWVYEGFEQTYQLLGVDFQKDYYESETYKLGKDIVEEGLEKGVFYRRKDGAVAIDLTPDGLDEKVLLRGDGTSIYITQDLGTAILRHNEFSMDKMIYVVANEQDYHFKVLKLCLQKLGRKWADGIYHLSYALVESPTGRFKSREGKTADADDLIADVLQIAETKTKELGKVEDFTAEQAEALYKTIGLGALKYLVLKVNPYRKIVFNPEEDINFNGQTGPFIQYTHARICAVLRKAGNSYQDFSANNYSLQPAERELMIQLHEYANVVRNACEKYDPSELANYIYNIAKLYNKFYHDHSILNADSEIEKNIRLAITALSGRTIKRGMKLLGIEVPDRM